MKLTDEEVAILLHHPYFEKMWTEFEDHIKKLEERILALERQESVVHILPSDNYYWEHG